MVSCPAANSSTLKQLARMAAVTGVEDQRLIDSVVRSCHAYSTALRDTPGSLLYAVGPHTRIACLDASRGIRSWLLVD